METWRLVREDGSPYLTRRVLWGANALEHHDPSAPFSVFVHDIHTEDNDRHLHNHPWAWSAALVLSGGYIERRISGTRRLRRGDLNVFRPDDYHSIVAVEPGTRTLFLCGREEFSWGFLVDGVHVPHGRYLARPGAHHMVTERIA